MLHFLLYLSNGVMKSNVIWNINSRTHCGEYCVISAQNMLSFFWNNYLKKWYLRQNYMPRPISNYSLQRFSDKRTTLIFCVLVYYIQYVEEGAFKDNIFISFKKISFWMYKWIILQFEQCHKESHMSNRTFLLILLSGFTYSRNIMPFNHRSLSHKIPSIFKISPWFKQKIDISVAVWQC